MPMDAEALAADLERRANAAFVDEDYEMAVALYGKVLALEPYAANIYSNRAMAHTKLGNFPDAVSDASMAIQLEPTVAKAYLRKGIACFELEEYQTAKSAFEAGAAIGDHSSPFNMWIRKCDVELEEEMRSSGRATHSNGAAPAGALPVPKEEMPVSNQFAAVEDVVAKELVAPPALAPPPPKYRHEWYQIPSHVVVTVFAKNIRAEDLHIDIGEQILSVGIPVEGYSLQLRLFAKILPDASKYTLMSTKIEIRLAKAAPINWKSLEYTAQQSVDQPYVAVKEEKATTSYPSSRKQHVDWNKLEAEVKAEEKGEKLEGDQALNKLFQDIYCNADEDTRRAMNKSFVESNGTVLSTNWKDVGSKMVTGKAPEGSETHDWSSK